MKIKRLGISNKDKITPLQEEQPTEPVRILEAREKGGWVHLRVSMSKEFYNELYGFLKQTGLTCWGNDKKAIPLFLQFGLSEDSREELERIKGEFLKVSSRYAAMSFQTSEYYAKSSAIAMGLRQHLRENKSLKRKLRERDLGEYVSEDEWDNWDDDFINELYRRYVFCK
jgi:hypothetical protein